MRWINSGVGCRPARRTAGSVAGKRLKMTNVIALTKSSSTTIPARRRTMYRAMSRFPVNRPTRVGRGAGDRSTLEAQLPQRREVPVPGRRVPVLDAAHVRRDDGGLV